VSHRGDLKRNLFTPIWPMPNTVMSAVTLRYGGVSSFPFGSNNLAAHVGDDPSSVASNRRNLLAQIGGFKSPLWLDQVHGTTIVNADESQDGIMADGSYSRKQNRVCLVMTADCVPILLCNRHGDQVAAVHAGWRGLSKGIISRAVSLFGDPSDVLVYLGPAIGVDAYEVNEDVRRSFLNVADESNYADRLSQAFKPIKDRFMLDLCELAKIQLNYLGVQSVYGGNCCTFSDEKSFFSFRRDRMTGRNASMIWLR
jgi:YfiH family protein